MKKKCSTCKKKKNIECFGRDSQQIDGHRYSCKECRKFYIRKLKRKDGKIFLKGKPNQYDDYIIGFCEICSCKFLKRFSISKRCDKCSDVVHKIYCSLNSRSRVNAETIVYIARLRLNISVCSYCNRKFTKNNYKSFDHIIPLCLGGSNHIDNISICCIECNRSKAWLLLDDWIDLCKRVCETHKVKLES